MKVNEIFGPTIQGEGKSAGREVMFLRLGLCNLHCVWCDTPYSWDWKHYDYKKEVHEMSVIQVITKLDEGNIKALVISGGEPLIQQEALLPLLRVLRSEDWWIEVETNGTFKPLNELYELVDQINCSPKLQNCGDAKEKRVVDEALKSLSQNKKVWFKFVIQDESEIGEVLEYTSNWSMTQVYLMPLGKTREELEVTRERVKALAKKHQFQFSDRLHVLKWGNKRGV